MTLISGLGTDELGRQAAELIGGLGIDTSLLQTCSVYPTGTAEVRLDSAGAAEFAIRRPAAYDAIELSPREIARLRDHGPAWCYFGTLYPSMPQGRQILDRLLGALDGALRFLDLNLRPGSDSPELVSALLAGADVVKLSEDELERVRRLAGLPPGVEAFCHAATERFGWRAVSVTLGARGCALLAAGQYVEAPGESVVVADTVGAGDAFAAAFLHGLCRDWSADRIAAFANSLAAGVASRHGSLPDWTDDEAARLKLPPSA